LKSKVYALPARSLKSFHLGVLDRMLTETAIDIIGVTGTSAGAINAVLLADGIVRGGPDEARQTLRQFWETIGKMVGLGSFLWPISGEAAANFQLKRAWQWNGFPRRIVEKYKKLCGPY
jgi:NTE family protein